MPNIALLNYCNLQCPYCFANEFIEEKKQLITIEQLDKILNFLKTSRHRGSIGLIGGEPTLHPLFKDILIKVKNFSLKEEFPPPVIYTNGINLTPYIGLLKDVHMLINLNEPELIGKEKWEQIQYNFSILEATGILLDHITIGINLYLNIKDFSYIFDTAKKYGFKEIRCSIVAPTCNYKNINKEKYYKSMKPIFLKFVDKALENNINIILDCNKIPTCYFTEEELQKVKKICSHWRNFCNPVIDITPDFKATCCFGTYDLIDLNNFEDIDDVERFFLFNTIYQKTIKNGTEKCLSCKKFKDYSCQGGCLAFSK